MKNGNSELMKEEKGIEVLGKMMEERILYVKMNVYGDIKKMGNVLISI